MEATTKINWPDLTKDTRAWELAKKAAEPGEELSDTVARANRIALENKIWGYQVSEEK